MSPLLFKQLIIPELNGKLCQDISREVALYLIKHIFITILSIKLIVISHFPIENRKASMDCLEGQSKVAENFKS